MTDLSYIIEGLRPLAVAIADLIPDPTNARVHGKRNLDAIRSSLSQFGQVKPIAVRRSDNVVIAGNGRLKVALEMGWTHMAAVLMEGTPQQLKAFALVDNKSAELGTWDELALADLVRDANIEVDLTAFGFSQNELAALADAEEPVLDTSIPQESQSDAPSKPPAPRTANKAKAPGASPGQQRPVAGKKAAANNVTEEEWAVVHEAAAAIRDDREDETMSLGACLRVMARRYLKTRPGV